MKIYIFVCKVRNLLHRVIIEPEIKKTFASCGSDVRIERSCDFYGAENIYLEDDIYIAKGTKILSTMAKVVIGSHVMFGPDVKIITGDHRTDIIGKFMKDIQESEKLPENDQDVIIEDDVWVGAGATILKGVTISRGSIIASGAVVVNNVPPYTIVGGIPAKVLKGRFNSSEIKKHENLLYGAQDEKYRIIN